MGEIKLKGKSIKGKMCMCVCVSVHRVTEKSGEEKRGKKTRDI